jgi:hypothetical protein
MLGEMHCSKGEVEVSGRIAYMSQENWIRNTSLRNNVLFGLPYDADRYHMVLDAAALRPDIAILADGDATEIGERGVTLSGGQKARVSLARAVYRAALSDIYLLDGELCSSAVLLCCCCLTPAADSCTPLYRSAECCGHARRPSNDVQLHFGHFERQNTRCDSQLSLALFTTV